jgi:hypothetical protein
MQKGQGHGPAKSAGATGNKNYFGGESVRHNINSENKESVYIGLLIMFAILKPYGFQCCQFFHTRLVAHPDCFHFLPQETQGAPSFAARLAFVVFQPRGKGWEMNSALAAWTDHISNAASVCSIHAVLHPLYGVEQALSTILNQKAM